MTQAGVAPFVRSPAALSLVVLALLLAGCALPGTPAKPDPLFGLCPQWLQGPGAQDIGLHLSNNESAERVLGPAENSSQGRPLDLYRFTLSQLDLSGRLEVRALAADGHQLAIRDYRQQAPQLVPVIVLADNSAAGHEFDVFLSPVTQNGTASPAPVTLRIQLDNGEATLALHVTFHYKVCGAIV